MIMQNKNIIIALLTVTLLFVSCGIDPFADEDIPLVYKTSYKPVPYTETSVVLDIMGAGTNGEDNYLVVVDTEAAEIIGSYYFKEKDIGYIQYTQINEKLFMNFNNDYYGDFVELDMITGKLKKLPFFDNYGYGISSLNDTLYMGSGYGHNYNKLREYNTQTGNYTDIVLGQNLSQWVYRGFVNDSRSYLVTGHYGQCFTDLTNKETYSVGDLLKSKFLYSMFCVELVLNSKTGEDDIYFTSIGYRNEQEELTGDFDDRYTLLFRIDSINDKNCEELILIDKAIEIQMVNVMNDTIIFKSKKQNDKSKQQFMVYDKATNVITNKIDIYPSGNQTHLNPEAMTAGLGVTVYANNTYWWLHEDSKGNIHVVRMNEGTYEQELIPLEEWQLH